MFPRRYYAGTYFAPRYYPQSQGVPSVIEEPRQQITAVAGQVTRTAVAGQVTRTGRWGY